MAEGQFFTACRYSETGERLFTGRCAHLGEFLTEIEFMRNDIGHWPKLGKLEPIFVRPASETEVSRVRQIAYRCSGVMTAAGVPDFSYAAVIWPPHDETTAVADYTERLSLLRDLHCDDDAADHEFNRVCRQVFGSTLDDIQVPDEEWDQWRLDSEAWSIARCRAAGYDLTLTSAMEVTDSEDFRLMVRAMAENLLRTKEPANVVEFAVESRPVDTDSVCGRL